MKKKIVVLSTYKLGVLARRRTYYLLHPSVEQPSKCIRGGSFFFFPNRRGSFFFFPNRGCRRIRLPHTRASISRGFERSGENSAPIFFFEKHQNRFNRPPGVHPNAIVVTTLLQQRIDSSRRDLWRTSCYNESVIVLGETDWAEIQRYSDVSPARRPIANVEP